MKRKINWLQTYKTYLAVSIVCVMLSAGVLPVALAINIERIEGFDKGSSYKSVVPMKKTTFINYDEESYLDDYAYLAAIPTAVFRDRGRLFSHPLLFYQDEYPVEDDKEKSLNARQGLDYFMEDWMEYCNGRVDQMNLINVPRSKIDSSWKAKDYNIIESDDPYTIAGEIALHDWSYSDDAVIAVIGEEFEKPDNVTISTVEGTIPGDKKPIEETFYTPQLDKLNPRHHSFEVPEGYKYIKTRTWWASWCISDIPLLKRLVSVIITIPTADPESQLYCKYNDEWMQVASSQHWTIDVGMDVEKISTYAYTNGPWRLRITDIPTFGGIKIERYGTLKDRINNMIKGVTYQTDITIFPGVELELPDRPPLGCRNANFKLICNNKNADIGMALIGPAGEEIISTCQKRVDETEFHLDQLGECPPGKYYSIVVFKLEKNDGPIDFTVEYSWQQNFTKQEANSLTSATEGAVLASTLNAPLLYTSSSEITDATKDVLYKLGVENVYLVNLGEHLLKETEEEISKIAKISKHYKTPGDIYTDIMDKTGQNDIIITTIDPWTRWLVEERKPHDETKAALFIGPAAYIAAHHGSPVLIADNHPELSSAVTWHTEFWKRNGAGFPDPPGAPMALTGKQAYVFFRGIGIDQEGEESMITVADQYDIGASWDRTFVGKAYPGKFFGSPVDIAYWISRSVFYPALIFTNPAMDPNGIELIQGSESERKGLGDNKGLFPWGTFGLRITKESKEEQFYYPVLHTYVTYNHRLNERFEKYYGFQYECADDIIPGVTASDEAIDEGVVSNKKGAIWPDMSSSEVTPFYLEKGGYGNVFSTSYSAIIDNLNNGVLMWITGTHGSSGGGGELMTWDPKNSDLGKMFKKEVFGFEKEKNPWRGYDWYLGSTKEPDTMTMEVHGFLPALSGNPDFPYLGLFPTGPDFWPSERPIKHAFYEFVSHIPILKQFVIQRPWLTDSGYYKDGVVGSHAFSTLAFVVECDGYNLDENLGNIHSCGWILSACLPAYKYMHLTMVRHGSVFQVMDPWPTSWYAYWTNTMPRDIALGDTVGQAYSKGISHVGRLYVTDPAQWWWDGEQNICYFGDPDLRVFVPGTEYSNSNYWEEEDTKPLRYDEDLSIDGHMPYGATSYPREKVPVLFWEQYLWIIISIVVIAVAVLIVAAVSVGKKRKR